MMSKLKKMLARHSVLGISLIVSLLAALYWGFVASDRYVSVAHVLVQKTELSGAQGADLGALLTGSSGGRTDQLLLRNYLLSIDVLQRMDQELNLRAHYSDSAHDVLSRLRAPDMPIEDFHRYYLSRTSVDYDDYSGVLVIKSQAYDPEFARRITTFLVSEGERFMNTLAQGLAQEQVAFLERQLVQMEERVMKAREAVLSFQDKEGLVSPQATAESIAAIVARLETQRSELQAQRSGLQAYLVPNHPNIVMLNQQIAALERQIAQEQAKLAAPSGKTLNRAVEAFQRLELEAEFAQELYKTALSALERGRLEATRTIKKVSILQAPTLPEYAQEPRRLYNILVFLIVATLLAGVVHLLLAIVRDHAD